jgi:hypothetical protein
VDQDEQRNSAEWVFWWSLVYGANLVLPLPLSLAVCGKGGQVGVMFGAGLVWAVGLIVCLRPGRLRGVLLRGASVVAWTQFCPVLQIGAGLLALWTGDEVARSLNLQVEGPVAEVGFFLVTLLTAQPLLLAAFVFGGGHRLLFDDPDGGDDPPGDEPATSP